MSVTSIEDYRPHITVPLLNGNVAVVSVAAIEDWIKGKTLPELTDSEDDNILIRSILSEWLNGIRKNKHE